MPPVHAVVAASTLAPAASGPLVWAGAGLGLLAVVGLLVLLHRRPWRGPRTRYPVVLAHGVMGVGTLGLGGTRRDYYFRGVADHLRALGLEVHCPSVPPLKSVAERAQALADYVEALPARKVNLVAHSMGGLDARYAIAHLGLARRVASLTTIGTPHRGTPVADLGLETVAAPLHLDRLLGGLGVTAFFDLTTRRMTRFNAETRDARRVRYASVVSVARPEQGPVRALLRPTHAFLHRRAGDNDGMVPADSQAWGKVLWRIDADHFAQVGWSEGFDAPALYERLARRLRSWGC